MNEVTQSTQKINPYPGPQPFSAKESEFFFGREHIESRLVSIVVSNRVTMIYAQSGAGKTSLLEARLLPALTKRKVQVLPVARVSGISAQDIEDDHNIYKLNVLRDWQGENSSLQIVADTLSSYLKQLPHATDELDITVPRVVVFDQFEELFTFYPTFWQQRSDFFADLNQALQIDKYLRLVFILREEYIAQFDPYKGTLSDFRIYQFRLERMQAVNAAKAIIEPARKLGVEYTPDAVKFLLSELLKVQVKDTENKVTTGYGEFVELVQLQIVCHQLWKNVQTSSQNKPQITLEDVHQFGNISNALAEFYDNCLTETVAETGADIATLRYWFEDQLLISKQIRNLLYFGDTHTGGMPNDIVKILEDKYIIRRVHRSNADWYELTHDLFINAVLRANQQYQSAELAKLEATEQEIKRAREQLVNTLLTYTLKGARLIARVAVVAVVGLIISAFVFVFWAENRYDTIIREWQDEIAALGTSDFDFQTTTILAADDTVIAEIRSGEGVRTVVSIEDFEVSPFFIHAIVSSEDPQFYSTTEFTTVDVWLLFLQNLFNQQITSGKSFITQQIVRDRVLGSNSVSFDRKLTETLLAIELQQTYTKNEILDIYINEFFYGQQSYGVEAASQFYFNIPASDLNAAQSAMLAGILPSPSNNNPVNNLEAAISNMQLVLDHMIDADCLPFQHGEWAERDIPFCFNEQTLVNDGTGNNIQLFRRNPDGSLSGAISLQIAQIASANYAPRQSDIQYPHFVFYVLGQLDSVFGGGAYTERGFTVRTTLVPRIQNTAEAALRQGVNQLSLNGIETGGVIVTDPRTGAILAMVGSPDFNNVEISGQSNQTLMLQQPGSAIMPLVYATALQGNLADGYLTPASILWDVPSQYNIGGAVYQPFPLDGRYRGPMSVRNALAQSLNIPAVKAYAQFGSEAFLETATSMGVNFGSSTPTLGLPTAVGATDVTLLSLTNAYGTIANDGNYVETFTITEITERSTNGNEVPVALVNDIGSSDDATQVISPQVAYLLQNILSDDAARVATTNGIPATFPVNSVISGSSFGLPNQNAIAVKTGTGDSSRLWTIGFTNNYAVGVWIGRLNQSMPLAGQPTGLTGAAPIWHAIMREALDGQNPGTFEAPTGIVQDVVCQLSGTLAPEQDSSCPLRITEIYAQDQPPPPESDGYVQIVNIHSWTGLRANQFCPSDIVAETFLNIDDPFALNWLNTTLEGQQIVSALGLPSTLEIAPTAECQSGQVLPTVFINFPQENAQLQETVSITGQISALGLGQWELQISEAGTDDFRTIMDEPRTEEVQLIGSSLYEWDTTSVANGVYILRLAVYADDGEGYIFRDVRVNVANN